MTPQEIEALKAERDSLSVMTECLKQHMSRFHEIDGAFSAAQWQNTADALIKLTPQQCLREIEANAGRAGFIAGAEWWAQCEIDDTLHLNEDEAADEYAAKVRQGGAG